MLGGVVRAACRFECGAQRSSSNDTSADVDERCGDLARHLRRAAQSLSRDVPAPPPLADEGAHVLPLPPKTVTIPMEKLKLMQDSLQRAEHAISSSLAFTVEQSNKLANERLIVQNAIDVIT